jgi:hypothetical protein
MTIPNTHTSLDPDERARKRAAIGLAPRRPTAKAEPQRPPRPDGVRRYLWSLVLLVVALIMSTSLLVIARLMGSPTDWPSVRENLTSWLSSVDIDIVSQDRETSSATPVGGAHRLIIDEEFKTEGGVLPPNIQDGQWSLAALPGEGVYRMQIAPNRLAWSTLGAVAFEDFSLEVSITIASVNPAGYAGLIGRYQDSNNFYLFAVDGQGRWQVQLLQDGELLPLGPWQALTWLNPAGESNLLALEDDGQIVRLYLNGDVIYELVDSALPPGDAGVFGAAPADIRTEIDVDWLRLYAQAEE